MLQRINAAGLALIKSYERCVLRAYRDSGGVWTIGWGHTGPDVVEGLFWGQEEADQALLKDLGNAERAVNSFVHRVLNENQFSALVSLTYNIGSGNFFESSCLVFLNHAEYEKACQAMGLFIKVRVAGALVIKEDLVRRRADEMALFRTPPEVFGPPTPPGWDTDPRNPQKS